MDSLLDVILRESNMRDAIKAVERNNGAPGVDGMTVNELDEWWHKNGEDFRQKVYHNQYKPSPVKRVYIPKPNGKRRPLGIPTVIDRTLQQATAQILDLIFDVSFSHNSFGFRRKRSAHDALHRALEYLNDGYTWIVDLDIEKFFDRVNHDKLISIIRKIMNEKEVLHLIRLFLRAGVMEEGVVTDNTLGTPQGGCISPLLANIYLNELDQELESRGLRFVRYADDVVIFVKSERSAERVMKSVSAWLEKELFLTASPTKTKVCRPTDSQFLGFTFWKSKGTWKLRPTNDRKQRLKDKVKEILCRKKASAMKLEVVFKRVNWVVRGWINYFSISSMKTFLKEFSGWLRHKIRVVIVKQWKKPKTIYRNLMILNKKFHCGYSDEKIRQFANSRLGIYRTTGLQDTTDYFVPKPSE